MKVLNFKDLMKKNILKIDTRNESQLQKFYNYKIFPRDSKIYSDKGIINIDNGSMGGTHWTCFIVRITNHILLTRLEVSQINFYLNNYLNQ